MMPLLSTQKAVGFGGAGVGQFPTPILVDIGENLILQVTFYDWLPSRFSDLPTTLHQHGLGNDNLWNIEQKKNCGREENPTMKIDFVGLFSKYYIHTEIIYMKSLQQDQTDVGVCCSISVFLQKQVAKTISRALARKLLVWLGLVWKFELTSIVDPKQTLVKDLKTRNLNNLYRS